MGSDALRQARDNHSALAEGIKRSIEESFELGYNAGWSDGYDEGMKDGRRAERFVACEEGHHNMCGLHGGDC